MAATQQPPTPPAGQPASPAQGQATAAQQPMPATEAQAAAPTQKQPAAPQQGRAQTCASCGSPLAADQRYCLACGARRGEPRVPLPGPAPAEPATRVAVAEAPARPPSEVSPLAAVIGIALLGGMLLIGVLIGRGANDAPPAPMVEVDSTPSAQTTTPSAGGESEAVTDIASEWPAGTDGFTVQLNTLPKDGSTPQSVDAAKQQAIEDGAIDAAVLDSDLHSSLPPGNYVIYSGVHTDRRSAEVALKGLNDSFPAAAVIEVSDQGGEASGAGSSATGDASTGNEAAVPEPPTSDVPRDDAASGGASAGGQDRGEELR